LRQRPKLATEFTGSAVPARWSAPSHAVRQDTFSVPMIVVDLAGPACSAHPASVPVASLIGAIMPRSEPGTYVTDLTHFDGALDPGSNAPAAAKRLAKFFDDLVRVASREIIGTIRTDVRCFKKPARRPCGGK